MSVEFLIYEFGVDSIGKDAHAFAANYSYYIFDDVNLIDSHGEFEIADEGPGL